MVVVARRSAVTTDLPPYARIPEWLLFHPAVSAEAVRVFGVLARHGDHICPSRKRISEFAHCSIRTVDKCLAELVAVGAVAITRRVSESGDPTSSVYHLRYSDPSEGSANPAPPSADSAPPSANDDTRGSAENDTRGSAENDTLTIVSLNESNLNDEIAPTSLSQAGGRKRDIHWDTQVEIFGFSPTPKTPEHGRWNKAVGIWRQLSATPDQMRLAAEEYRRRYDKADFNAFALASRAEHLLRGHRPQAPPRMEDLDPGIQAIATYRREDNRALQDYLRRQNGDAENLSAGPFADPPRMVEAHGVVRPRLGSGQDRGG